MVSIRVATRAFTLAGVASQSEAEMEMPLMSILGSLLWLIGFTISL
jgi:hypothetical protein